MDAAAILRGARREAGLSLRSLARLSGTSYSTLSAYENGRAVPRVDTMDRILRAAGFASDVELVRRVDASPEDRHAKGEELRQALELAAMFPARHAPRLEFPRLGPTWSPEPA